jgi:hypothetical protein
VTESVLEILDGSLRGIRPSVLRSTCQQVIHLLATPRSALVCRASCADLVVEPSCTDRPSIRWCPRNLLDRLHVQKGRFRLTIGERPLGLVVFSAAHNSRRRGRRRWARPRRAGRYRSVGRSRWLSADAWSSDAPAQLLGQIVSHWRRSSVALPCADRVRLFPSFDLSPARPA